MKEQGKVAQSKEQNKSPDQIFKLTALKVLHEFGKIVE
jgi:hypothetical protein